MWLSDDRFRSVDIALRTGRPDAEALLREVLEPSRGPDPVPTACPQCAGDLAQRALPALEVFVSVCPKGHGAWMGPKTARELRRFIAEHASPYRRRRASVQAASLALAAAGVWVVIISANYLSRRSHEAAEQRQAQAQAELGRSISETYWPRRDLSGLPALPPLKQSAIDHQEDLLYLTRALALLETGISNRYNVEGGLAASSDADRALAVGRAFDSRAQAVIKGLEALKPSPAFKDFHANVLEAARLQRRFLRDYAQARAKDSATTLVQLLDHPDLKAANAKLWEALRSFERGFPNVDAPTHDAVEQRLCQFDII